MVPVLGLGIRPLGPNNLANFASLGIIVGSATKTSKSIVPALSLANSTWALAMGVPMSSWGWSFFLRFNFWLLTPVALSWGVSDWDKSTKAIFFFPIITSP